MSWLIFKPLLRPLIRFSPNGVEINAKFATVGGEAVDSVEVPDDLNMKDGVVPNQTISVGKQKMDGRTLLNYARFRKDDEGDFWTNETSAAGYVGNHVSN